MIYCLDMEQDYRIDEDKINMSLAKWGRIIEMNGCTLLKKQAGNMLMTRLTNWLLSGDPLSVLIDSMSKDSGGMFTRKRAERIAVTETTRLHAMGNQMAWEESDMKWIGILQ